VFDFDFVLGFDMPSVLLFRIVPAWLVHILHGVRILVCVRE